MDQSPVSILTISSYVEIENKKPDAFTPTVTGDQSEKQDDTGYRVYEN